MIQAATDWAERETWRSFLQQTWVLKLDRFPYSGEPIWLPRPPLTSVTSIVYTDANGDSQTLATSKYDVDTASATELTAVWEAYNENWPTTRYEVNAITVTYVAGYGTAIDDVPMALRHAIKMYAAMMYCNRTGADCVDCSQSLCDRLISPYQVQDPSGLRQLL